MRYEAVAFRRAGSRCAVLAAEVAHVGTLYRLRPKHGPFACRSPDSLLVASQARVICCVYVAQFGMTGHVSASATVQGLAFACSQTIGFCSAQ